MLTIDILTVLLVFYLLVNYEYRFVHIYTRTYVCLRARCPRARGQRARVDTCVHHKTVHV